MRLSGFVGWCCAGVLLLMQPCGVVAQDSLRLSLEDAVQQAMTKGEEMRIAAAQIDVAASQIASVRADALPQLAVNLGFTRQIQSVFRNSGFGGIGTGFPIFEPDSTAQFEQRLTDLEKALPTAGLSSLLGQFTDSPFGRLNTWNAGFTVNQTLFHGNRLWTAPRVARRVRNAAEAQYKEQAATVSATVKRSYYTALLAEETLHIARLSLEQAERQLAFVQRKHREGTSSDFELLQAEVQRDNQTPEIVNAEQQYALLLLDLKRLINAPPAMPLKLTSTMTDPLQSPPVIPPLTSLLDRSGSRPAIEAAQQETAARQMAIGVAKSDIWPKISLFSNYNRQAFPTGFLPKGKDWRADWSVGFTVNLNLFDGLRTQALTDQARANYRLAEERQAQTKETVAVEVEQAYRNLKRALTQIQARRRTIEQADRALRLADIRFEEGISTQLEVSDARLQLQRARLNYAQSVYDYHIAWIDLERAADIALERNN